MSKLLICDKDNTLIRPKSGSKFVQHPTDQILLPNVAKTIARYAADGWTMAIASNQGGVAAGYMSLGDCRYMFSYVMSILPNIEYCIFCPSPCDSIGDVAYIMRRCDYDRAETFIEINRYDTHGFSLGFRKPNPGMLVFLKRMLEVTDCIEECLYVGDRPEDEAAAIAAGVPFRWASEFFGGESE